MKTAMQVLLNYVDSMPFSGSKEHSDIVNVIQQELMLLEKQQIINARASLYSELLNIPINAPRKYAEDYYNQTFKP